LAPHKGRSIRKAGYAFNCQVGIPGFCTQGADCVGDGGSGSQNAPPHQHDFGSILAFVEYNFGLPLGGINLANGFPFADYYAPELQALGGPYAPLGDFFNISPQTPQRFMPITLVNNSFTFDYFRNFNGPFQDPDNDMIDSD
jgi:hypothetical protein